MNKGDRIDPDEFLLRRGYYPDKRFIKIDGSIGSRAFVPRKNENGEISVDIESLTTYEKSIKDVNKYRLLRIQCSFVNSLGLECIYDPDDNPSDPNPAHSLICGFVEDDEKIPAVLAKKAVLVPYPVER